MKIAVYTIALNEEAHAEAFMDASKDADLVVVGDTGSTDRTVEIIQDRGGTVVPIRQLPWRFDTPRNIVLSLLPSDVDFCLALDLDEVTKSDWRHQLESRWDITEHHRLRFRYVHSFNSDGSYGTVGMKDFGHARRNYMWRHAVHEKPYFIGDGTENVCTIPEMVIEHHQDISKSRASYIQLLEVECKSPTATPRHIFWLGREHIYNEDWEPARVWLEEFLAAKETWNVERGHAMRLLAKALAHLKEPTKALSMHFKAIESCPWEREVWMDLAWYHQGRDEWAQAYGAIVQCLSITAKPEHYLVSHEAWGAKAHDLASLCAFKLEIHEKAQAHVVDALKLEPTSEHLQQRARRLGVKLDA